MQLLTATKLSTVAMLVMASFFLTAAVPMDHQDELAAQSTSAAQAGQPAAEMMPVPAVPMEQPNVEMTDVVEVAPAVVQPPVDISAYKTPAPGQPSDQAKADMLDILSLKELENTAMNPSYAEDPQQPFSALPDEMILQTAQHMNLFSLRSSAQTNQRPYNMAKELLPPKAKEFMTDVDTLWDEYAKGLERQNLSEFQRKPLIAASSVWEQALMKATGQKQLKECPYELLPYTPDERTGKHHPSDQELLGMIRSYNNQYETHMRHNICRLAVNGGYPWLMKIVTSHARHSEREVLSVLGQLKLYSPDKALVSDFDKLLKLFAAIMRADRETVPVEVSVRYLLMVSTPAVIPALDYSPDGITKAALLLLAIKQQQSNPDARLDLDGINLPESVKKGEVTEFIDNVKPELKYMCPLSIQYSITLYRLVYFDKDIGQTRRHAMNDLLDHPSKGFVKEGNAMQLSKLADVLHELHPLEVPVNLLNEDDFIKLYDELFESEKHPLSVVFAGRSRHGTRALEHAFEKVFGPVGTSISDDVEVDKKALNAEHLAKIVMICAINCTDENKEVFFKLLIKKIRDTPQLPGWTGRGSSSATAAQEVASEVPKLIQRINKEHQRLEWNIPVDRKQSIQDEVNQIIDQLNKFANELTQDAESTPPAENSPGSLQTLSG